MNIIQNIFGTDGIRATVGQEPFTIEKLSDFGKAIARWAHQKYGHNPRILIAHDTRGSCSLVKAALKSGLLTLPVHVYDAGVLTSPGVYQLMYYTTQFDCGIVISASHNPHQDNGIKILDALTGKLSEADEEIISSLFLAPASTYDYHTFGTDTHYPTAYTQYANHIFPFFEPHFLQHIKIVLDCAHGAAYELAPRIFKHFGANVITIGHQPNGININKQCGALYPELLQQTVIAENADIGFAFDGDGDRLIMVTKQGHIKNGDDILALLLAHPLYKDTSTVVGTIMTNKGFESFLHAHNKTLIRTAVGDKYVLQKLIEHNLLLGGETSGHIIARDYLATGDGIFTALRCLQTIILTQNWEAQTFVRFPQIIMNIPITIKKDLQQQPLADIINTVQASLEQGRLIVRYSGTEPLLRIMVEETDFEQAQTICTSLAKQLKKELL